ncbi:hypothetical protein KCU71_g12049, partial [Aureobasidium melanogenum]
MPSIPKFSYNVTRDYPYQWFTPVAIIAGSFLTVLFSAINFYTAAYTMVPVTTPDPSRIETEEWTGLARLLASKYQPKCDDVVLPVGTTFRTNQSLFEYEIIYSRNKSIAALTYHNGLIDQCYPHRVLLDFSTWYNRPANYINVTAWGLVATVDLWCCIHCGSSIAKYFDIEVQYDPIKDALPPGQKTQRPMWDISSGASNASQWAQVLMFMFWEETIGAITHQTTTLTDSETTVPQYNLTHGFIELDIGTMVQGTMQNDHFFNNASWVFFDAAENEKYVGATDSPDFGSESDAQNSIWPCIWSPVDRFAKAILSAVYLDLGLSLEPQASMVTDVDTLRYWSANLSTIAEQDSLYLGLSMNSNNLTITDYDAQQQLTIASDSKSGTLPENPISPAVIRTTYTCQQPQLKSRSNIFISILVADLVFLRAAWSLYNLVVGYFLKSRHPEANICDECLARKKEDDEQVGGKEETACVDKMHGVDEHTIELDYLGPPSPDIHRDDQSSAQSLLTHRHV